MGITQQVKKFLPPPKNTRQFRGPARKKKAPHSFFPGLIYLLVAVVPAALVKAQAEHGGKLGLAGDLGVLPEHLAGGGAGQEDEVQGTALAYPAGALALSGCACSTSKKDGRTNGRRGGARRGTAAS